MLNYVYGNAEILAPLIAAAVPSRGGRPLGKCLTVAVVERGTMIAAWAYHDWNSPAGTIDITVAATPGHHWLTPETLKHLYQYPFLYLDCQMVMHTLPAADARTLRQLAALNYTLIRAPRLYGRQADGVVATLTREAWEGNMICRRYKHHTDEYRLMNSEAA